MTNEHNLNFNEFLNIHDSIIFNNETNYRLSFKKVTQIIDLFKCYSKREIDSLEITLVHDKKMTEINENHLNHIGSTDIITFEYETNLEMPINGEMIICKDEAKRNAALFKVSLEREIIRLIYHGLLHLSGYDDKTPDLRAVMKVEEDKLVEMWFNKEK